MKRIISIIAVTVAIATSAQAQGLLGGLLGSTGNSTVDGLVNTLVNTVYSAPISLDGTYIYAGSAITVTSSEGGIVSNLAGTAVTSQLEAKVDEKLAKYGIAPGVATWIFNNDDNSFVLNIGTVSLPGTYKVGDGEKTVTLTFGKTMKYLSMTGTLESSSTGCKMLFTADKFLAFAKKYAAILGQKSTEISSITALLDSYDQCRIGWKLTK